MLKRSEKNMLKISLKIVCLLGFLFVPMANSNALEVPTGIQSPEIKTMTRWEVAPNTRAADLSRPLYRVGVDKLINSKLRVAAGTPCGLTYKDSSRGREYRYIGDLVAVCEPAERVMLRFTGYCYWIKTNITLTDQWQSVFELPVDAAGLSCED